MKNITFNNSVLTQSVKKSFLSSSASSAATELSVESIKGFAINQVLLIGEMGNEKTEIIHTHAATGPSSGTVTLASGLNFSHPQGTVVYIISWNQVIVYHAETVGGTKTALDTINIQPDQKDTLYKEDTQAEGFYFTRLKNSITDDVSNYSDPLPVGGYGYNTVGSIISYALKRNKLETFTKFIDYEFCIEEINSCLKYITGKLKKWTRLQEFNYEAGTLTRGVYSLDMPTGIWKHSYKSVLDVRVESNLALTYKDKKEFNDLFLGVRLKEATTASIGDTTLELDDTTNLDADGNVMVNGNLITYTAISSNTLTGIPATGSGSITATITAGDNVWQGSYDEGTPLYFTVHSGKMFFYPLTSSSTPRRRIFADFWKEAPEIDSDYDEIDMYRYDMVKYYLTWVIKMQLKNDSNRDLQDGEYIQFEMMLRDAIKGEISGQKYKWKPKLNTINYKNV